MQEISLRTLSHLSMGTDWHRHKLVQVDILNNKLNFLSAHYAPTILVDKINSNSVMGEVG
jgi:hypothetical protein